MYEWGCYGVIFIHSQISEMISESDEKELLLTLDAQGFAGLVQCTKMAVSNFNIL